MSMMDNTKLIARARKAINPYHDSAKPSELFELVSLLTTALEAAEPEQVADPLPWRQINNAHARQATKISVGMVYDPRPEFAVPVVGADDLDIAAIQARVDAATEGPWESLFHELTENRNAGYWIMADATLLGSMISHKAAIPRELDSAKNDAQFIAHAREDIPALIARIRQLEARSHPPVDVKGGDHA
jgi:hypothetical protein